MREIVATLAILGALIEAVTAIGGPQMAGVGMITREPAPAMATGPLLVGLGVAAFSALGGARIAVGGDGRKWGVGLIAAAIVGTIVVGPWTGFFTLAAGFTALAGVLALFIRRRRRPGG